jgi:two-component system phosphate regulon sensor histidine kinase PhoR
LRSQRVDVRLWIRWGYVLFSLLFIIYVSDQVIKVACAQQDRTIMLDRATWIESVLVRGNQLDLSPVQEGLKDYAQKENVQITLYNPRGEQLFATSQNASRPIHISQVKKPSFHVKNEHAHYITPVRADQRVVGYLWMQAPKTEILGLGLLYLSFFLLGTGLLVYRDYLVRSYKVPVRFASRMAENILNGHYNMIASNSEKHDSVLRLNLALNKLSDALHEMSRTYRSQRDSMETLVENIGNGLIFIDGNGRIEYINRTFKEDFRTSAGHWELADYQEVIPYPEVNALIQQVFKRKKRLTKQLQFAIHIERKHFDVSCAPILDKHHHVRGIVVVFHDITGIKKLENMRRDFVANVSHELKTPITSLIGFAETLLDGAKDDKQMEEQFLNIILQEGHRLQSLVNDLLELSKIERAHFVIDWQTVSLSQVMDAVLLMFHEKAEKKQLKLIRKAGPEGWSLGDPYRIRQIMINLINNAIAYTPENGSITLSITESSHYAKFMIADTGMGMTKDQIPRIFERFYRIDKARSRDSGGTGLGLAIVKHLVEAHEGRIDVESEPGKGTTFTISFKKAPAPIG